MPSVTLEQLAAAVQGQLCVPAEARAWSGTVRIDSREVQTGDLFFALPGSRQDGHDFAEMALAHGAALAVVRADRAGQIAGPKLIVPDPAIALQELAQWHRRRTEALIIGVTGSVGKTTTRELIHAVLSGEHPGSSSRQNFNNDIGLPLSLLEVRPEHEFAVLELGATRIGDIARLAEIAQPEVGVITAIGSAHLETFGGPAGVLQGKGELFDALPAGGFAVLPGDCPRLRALMPRAKCPVILVGEQVDNRLRVSGIERTSHGLAFQFDGHRYHLPLLGRHHISNALCALAIGKEIGLSAAILADGLADFQPVAGRLQPRRIGDWLVLDDTYNASPQAFHAAIDTLMDLPRGPRSRRVVVAGDMLELGSTAQEEHRRLGALLGQHQVDRLLITGDHADDVAHGAITAGLPSHHIAAASDWSTFTLLLDCWLEPGDLILVKGSRGMRMERVIDWMAATVSLPDQRKCA